MSHVQDIERLLRDTMGLDAETLGVNAIERAVRARLAALSAEMQDTPPYSRYWQRLQQSPQELQALIEAIVVPETWFYRHREAFTALTQMVQEARASRRGTPREAQPIRLLSLPCSTGEEPYSMAMTMFDAGFAANDFTIDALDISERALAVAREGRYGRNSFRGPPGTMLFRDRYFTPEDENFRVIGALRSQVRWHAGNLFDASLVDRLGTFDFVFFRNVLIYFDRDGQRRAIAALEQLMRMGATLFAGPAEGGTLTSNGLAPTGHVQAFSFRVAGPVRDVKVPPAGTSRPTGTLETFRASAPHSPVDAIAQHRPTHAVQVAHVAHAAPAAAAASSVRSFAPPSAASPEPARPAAFESIDAAARADLAAQLVQAGAAADAGDFVQAVALCRAVLAADRANAQAEYLLGLVEDARGDAQGALIHYRRALYLDPGHYEALVHCAALLDARGDAAGAKRLLERADRAERAERNATNTTTTSESHDQRHRHGTRHR
ncbi:MULTISPECIES: CheR family methyltransferase [Pandoraea]|uniref:CheR family methyltransferase n=1 Tax=Pandoraea TaxID=93217 RepID=UPI001F5CE4CC|nr:MULTISPECIES: CheR family methyltransferase [Pandoraea]MCI3207226.1 chemotaxis protein CheR [Pandoraea sp. LA3]MDN4585255.1 chemotaxis protein CheR [Pandoraea capi]